MNTYSEIIIWAVIVVFTAGAVSTLIGVRKGGVAHAPAAAAVFANAVTILALLYVLWSNR